MTRQAIIRVLLSLLLLISQQMAATHVMSHLAGNLGKPAVPLVQAGKGGQDETLSSAVAQEQSCNKCLAFAQLAGPVVSSPAMLAVPYQASHAVPGIAARPIGARLILAFQSRAPPVLS